MLHRPGQDKTASVSLSQTEAVVYCDVPVNLLAPYWPKVYHEESVFVNNQFLPTSPHFTPLEAGSTSSHSSVARGARNSPPGRPPSAGLSWVAPTFARRPGFPRCARSGPRRPPSRERNRPLRVLARMVVGVCEKAVFSWILLPTFDILQPVARAFYPSWKSG